MNIKGVYQKVVLERMDGFDTSPSNWKLNVLQLNYTRVLVVLGHHSRWDSEITISHLGPLDHYYI